MESKPLPTQFAPAERLNSEKIRQQAAFFADLKYLRQLADGLPTIFVALNQNRQIVFGNQALADFTGKRSPEELYGLRPGEAFGCIHAAETEGGCGTAEFCKTCGAAHAILAAIDGKKNMQECRITTRDGESLDLRASACPMMDGSKFVSFTVEDISHEKRREVLERIFFHDVLNTAGGVRGLADLLKGEETSRQAADLIDMLHSGSNTLIEEIRAQRTLSEAENGDLVVEPEKVRTDDLLKAVIGLYEHHEVARKRRLQLHADTQSVALITDLALVRRVLGNMTKNALEASSSGQTVTLGARPVQDRVELWVHNQDGLMSRDSQLQVFQRSFSTKGKGRGLGTYSMKLITERYLKGSVSFTATPADGTLFWITLPLRLAG